MTEYRANGSTAGGLLRISSGELVIIRPAEDKDFSFFHELSQKAYGVLTRSHYTVEQITGLLEEYGNIDTEDDPNGVDFFKDWAATDKKFYVASLDGKIVGYGEYYDWSEYSHPDLSDSKNAEYQSQGVIIDGIVVDPSYARMGIGSALLIALEEDAQSEGIEVLQLEATLNSVEFYQKNGYQQGDRVIHHFHQGYELPVVKMSKQLTRAPDIEETRVPRTR